MSFNSDIILGALLVGTWANSVLYTVEIIQGAYYFRHFKNDSWKLKLLVASTIAVDSVSMIANYASVYLYTVSHWGNLSYLENQYWPLSLYLFTTGVVAALAQSFLTVRYWLLTKNHFVTLILFVFVTVSLGGAFASAVTIAMFPKYKDRAKATIPATTWLVSESVTDISIASALLWEFRKFKTSFKETSSLRDRLVAQTIQTGAAGATVALIVLVAFLANKESNVPTGIAYILGRIYCLTMLANLNLRGTGSPDTWLSKFTFSSVNFGTRGERGTQAQSEGGDDYGGIHVHRTAVVHIETPQEFPMGSLTTNPGQGRPNPGPNVKTKRAVNVPASYSSDDKQDLSVE